jgi:uncharacterized membrane protein (UPF0127 family)
LIQGANRPANPYFEPARGNRTDAGVPGFGTRSLSISPAPGLRSSTRDPCFLAAVTQVQQARGLMGQRSLHGFAGMVFVFAAPTTDAFYMRSTPMPLSVAWFDGQGSFIGARMMPPCPPDATACPTYSPGRPYLTAVEVPAGRLASMGIAEGATVRLGGTCRAS